MSSKTLIAIVVIIIVALGGYFLLTNRASAPTPENETPGDAAGATVPVSDVTTVTYTDEGFTPSEVTIKVGESVRWVNASSREMWVASAMHPTHTVYAGTTLEEHCKTGANDSFDQCESGGHDASYEFTFTKAGTWRYHDHVNAGNFGSVIVTE